MNIAIVDGYSTSRFLVDALRRAGVGRVHVSSQQHPPAVYVRAFDAARYDRVLPWTADLQRTVTALKDMGVDQVVAGTESGVILADSLNHELGLPGNRIEVVDARRDKAAMGDALRAADLDAARHALVDSVGEAVAWYRSGAHRTVVVKPRASAGSDNVRICETREEVAQACRAVLEAPNFFGEPNAGALVQEYLDGEEYWVNTVSRDGRHKVAEVWHCVKVRGPRGAPLYDFCEPLPVADETAGVLIGYVRKVLAALGIENGAAHSELKLTGRGPVLVETAARLMGAALPDLVAERLGVSQVSLLAQSLVDPEGFDAFDDAASTWSGSLRWVSLIGGAAGTAGPGAWRDALGRLGSHAGLVSRIKPGGPVPATVDLASAPGFVYLAAPGGDAVESDYRRVRELENDGFYLT